MRNPLLFTLTFFVGALFSAPAFAFRMEFVVTHAGKPLPGAEVCFQPSVSQDDTYRRWFYSNEIRCLPADDVLDFPAGQWNYFARHRDGFISPNPQLVVLDVAEPEAGYQRLRMFVDPAATIDISGIRLADDERIFLFFTNRTSPFGSSIHPIPHGTTRQFIPAGIDVIPIVVRNQRPIRLLEPVNGKAAAVVTARERKRAEGTVDVVAWVQLDVPAILKVAEPEKLAPFDVRLRIGRRTFAQQFPMRNGAASHLSLVTFVDVPKGDAKLELRGGDWLPHVREVALDGDLVVIEKPLTSAPAATIRVAWTLPPGSVAGADVPCEADPPAGTTEVLVRLQRCETEPCEMLSLERTEIAETGEVRFAGLQPGRYSIDAIVGGIRTAATTVECRVGEESVADVTPPAVTVRGLATREGAALSALLRFERGSARTDPLTGQYTLLLDKPVRAESVATIEPCDGSKKTLEVVPVALHDGAIFDLDLRDRETRVHVRDASTGRAIAAAQLTYSALGRDGDIRFASRAGTTDAEGHASIDAAPERTLKVCARADGYADACIELPGSDETRTARIALQRAASRRGRVVADGSLTGAMLYLAGASGELAETVPVGDDGTFHCLCNPARLAYVVLVSDRLPMRILPPPAEAGEELLVRVEPAPAARTFVVSLAEKAATRGGRFSLSVDGRLVPLLAVTNHQIKRRLPTVVLRGQQVPVADIAATAIDIVLVPLFEDLPPAIAAQDVATLREWQPVLPRKPLPPSGVVTFE